MKEIKSVGWEGDQSSCSSPAPNVTNIVTPVAVPNQATLSTQKRKKPIGILAILLLLVAIVIAAVALLGENNPVLKKANGEQKTAISKGVGSVISSASSANITGINAASVSLFATLKEVGITAEELTQEAIDGIIEKMPKETKEELIQGIADKLQVSTKDIKLKVENGIIIPIVDGVETLSASIDLNGFFAGVKDKLQ